MKKKRKNNCFSWKDLVLLIILIILFGFILWLHIFNFGKEETLKKPTGNIDVFEIECKCPEGKICNECQICEECEKKPAEPEKEVIPVTPGKPVDPYKWEEEVIGFNIFDNQVHWEMESELRIFTHPSYTFDGVIAPGVGNSYEFRVRNNNSFKVIYTMLFEEENEQEIDMRYRLKKNGSYVVGDSNTWVKYDSLNLTSILLNGNQSDTYILDWLWFESNDDTKYGLMGNGDYNLSIDIVGMEYNED